MEFEDGAVYEFRTSLGIMTFVSDSKAEIPIRVYGPNGLQLDPITAAKIVNCPKHGLLAGYMAWDLSNLASM